jgi:hypothetical protein
MRSLLWRWTLAVAIGCGWGALTSAPGGRLKAAPDVKVLCANFVQSLAGSPAAIRRGPALATRVGL